MIAGLIHASIISSDSPCGSSTTFVSCNAMRPTGFLQVLAFIGTVVTSTKTSINGQTFDGFTNTTHYVRPFGNNRTTYEEAEKKCLQLNGTVPTLTSKSNTDYLGSKSIVPLTPKAQRGTERRLSGPCLSGDRTI